MKKAIKATHRGYINIAGTEIPCAVLENNERIISQTGLFLSFDRPRKGEKRQEGLPSIIGAKNLLDFVTDDIREKCQPIPYLHTNGKTAHGYKAEVIPLICDLYLEAKEQGATLGSQNKIIARAGIIVRALAKIGITALIDEATGYQYERERDELQKLLSKYIAEDYLKWQTRFPKKYYKEIFRIYGWDYDPYSTKRPSYIGKFTNKYIYEQLPQGVLDELKRKNPVKISGNRVRRHHQYLTQEVGVPHLDKHLLKVITVMELSDSIKEFEVNFNKVFGKPYPVELPFE